MVVIQNKKTKRYFKSISANDGFNVRVSGSSGLKKKFTKLISEAQKFNNFNEAYEFTKEYLNKNSYEVVKNI